MTTLLTQVEVDPADPAFGRPSKPIGRLPDPGGGPGPGGPGDGGDGGCRPGLAPGSPLPPAHTGGGTGDHPAPAGGRPRWSSPGAAAASRPNRPGGRPPAAGGSGGQGLCGPDSWPRAWTPTSPADPHRRGEGGHPLRKAQPALAHPHDPAGGGGIHRPGPVRAEGSMLPKVQAAVRFGRSGPGRQTLITLPGRVSDALRGQTGTLIG